MIDDAALPIGHEIRQAATWAEIQEEARGTDPVPTPHVPQCYVCGVAEGHLHQLGCYNEPCPLCGEPLGWCSCLVNQQWPSFERFYRDGDGPTTDAELAALTQEWAEALQPYRRYPYISYPFLCPRCGSPDADLFMVPKEVWTCYIAPLQQHECLCRPCFVAIVRMTDLAG